MPVATVPIAAVCCHQHGRSGNEGCRGSAAGWLSGASPSGPVCCCGSAEAAEAAALDISDCTPGRRSGMGLLQECHASSLGMLAPSKCSTPACCSAATVGTYSAPVAAWLPCSWAALPLLAQLLQGLLPGAGEEASGSAAVAAAPQWCWPPMSCLLLSSVASSAATAAAGSMGGSAAPPLAAACSSGAVATSLGLEKRSCSCHTAAAVPVAAAGEGQLPGPARTGAAGGV